MGDGEAGWPQGTWGAWVLKGTFERNSLRASNPLGLVEEQHLRIRLALVYVHFLGVDAVVGLQA